MYNINNPHLIYIYEGVRVRRSSSKSSRFLFEFEFEVRVREKFLFDPSLFSTYPKKSPKSIFLCKFFEKGKFMEEIGKNGVIYANFWTKSWNEELLWILSIVSLSIFWSISALERGSDECQKFADVV